MLAAVREALSKGQIISPHAFQEYFSCSFHTVCVWLIACLEKCSAFGALFQRHQLSFKTLGIWCGVDLFWSSGRGSRHAGVNAGLTQKGSHTRV